MNAVSGITTSVRSALSSIPGYPKTPFFDGLSRSEIGSILAATKYRRYVANSIVLHQGDQADYLLLLAKGCARYFFSTEDGRKVLLHWLTPGELLGIAALLPRRSLYLVSTEMVKDSSLFVWRRDDIRQLCAKHPRLLENALPFASDHLTWFLSAHMALISTTARERLARVLLSLAHGVGQSVRSGIQIDVTNEQLANAANITPFTASRLLSEWQRKGVVKKKRRSLILANEHGSLLETT
jgi:CRP-like cAMP-binding protein